MVHVANVVTISCCFFIRAMRMKVRFEVWSPSFKRLIEHFADQILMPETIRRAKCILKSNDNQLQYLDLIEEIMP